MDSDTKQILLLNPINFEPVECIPQSVIETATTTNEIEVENEEDLRNVCRTCATISEYVIPIFMGEGLQNNLAVKINKHLPIQVSEDDVLPQVICYQCANTLFAWHELVECCLQADATLKTRLGVIPVDQNNSIDGNNIETETRDKLQPSLCITNIKDLITKHFLMSDVDLTSSSVKFVCEKCKSQSNQYATLESFVEHLQSQHYAECKDLISIEKFMREYASIVEVLAIEEEQVTNAESVKEVNIVKLQIFQCPFCTSSFSSSTRLICHLNQHADVCIEAGVNCCNTSYYNSKTFVSHLNSNHVNHSTNETDNCRSCGFVAKDANELQEHILNIHIEEVGIHINKEGEEQRDKWQKYIPAVCPKCNKTFSNKYNMLVHMKSHDGITEKYPCDRCSKSYKTQANLKIHQRIAHEGILSFLCSHCGEAFPSRVTRDVHKRIHTGDRPYSCVHCNQSYRAKNTLDRHMEIHFDIRNYECHICSKKFRKSTHLKYHVNTHQRKK